MKHKFLALSVAVLSIALGAMPASAADTDTAPAKGEAKQQVYGSQLMTRQERIDYHNKMRSLKTQEERDAFRLEHHRLMQERAKEKGVALPDMPPAQGMGPCGGTHPCAGMGPGMGPGGGPNGPAR